MPGPPSLAVPTVAKIESQERLSDKGRRAPPPLPIVPMTQSPTIGHTPATLTTMQAT
jgi:hypothetical protein